MRIHLWYSRDVKSWRWCITDRNPYNFGIGDRQETGDAKELDDSTFFKYKTKEVLIIEDFKDNIPEKLFFSLLNLALQDNKYFLITSTKPLNSYNFKLLCFDHLFLYE